MKIIKRQRTRGWSKAQVAAELGIPPEKIVNTQRPGPLGNPFRMWTNTERGRKEVTEDFEFWIRSAGEHWRKMLRHERDRTLKAIDALEPDNVLMCCVDWDGTEPAPDCHCVVIWRVWEERRRTKRDWEVTA